MSKRWLSIGGITLFLVAVFCVGFVVFYNRIQRSRAPQAESPEAPGSLINKPLPQAQLIDLNGAKVDEQILRRGKVILVFITTDCNACVTESRFLQTILARRTDVSFYGLVPFGKGSDSSQAAEKMFPFKVFYDEGNSFVRSMGINRVPVKVFLEDGIIKKGWIGAAMTEQSKRSFVEWFDGLP
jgi:peroxiredoxin